MQYFGFILTLILLLNSPNLAFAQNTSVQPTKIKFVLDDNRIFVDVALNNQGPFKFIFDTGGANTMTPEVAKALHLSVTPGDDSGGAGNGQIPTGNTEVGELSLGATKLTKQPFMVMDLSPIQRAFHFVKLDGIVGLELLQKFATLIDYDSQELIFYPSFPKEMASAFDEIPFELLFDKAAITVRIAGITAKVLIDTGDRSALTIFRNFRRHSEIAAVYKKKPIVTSGCGIGGPIPARIGRVKTFDIGGFQIKHLISRAPTTKGGFNSITEAQASIGNETLREFIVGIDFKNKLLLLKPSRQFGRTTEFVPVPGVCN